MRRPHRSIAPLAALIGLTACAGQPPPVHSRLDASGITVVTLVDPLVVARPVADLAAGTRDYAYLGPVEVNRMGELSYFLWVGLASTIDRERVNAVPEAAETLVVIVDQQPMTLALEIWQHDLESPPYAAAAPLYATLSARTTLDQIRRIAAAASVEIHIVSTTGAVRRYRHWQGVWPAWSLIGDAR